MGRGGLGAAGHAQSPTEPPVLGWPFEGPWVLGARQGAVRSGWTPVARREWQGQGMHLAWVCRCLIKRQGWQ